ncbi:MAG: PilZ domain-containing protein [Proteobacteria bacterium]|nr:PilZ domain-containing protein [Pseudomonadota bacterium]
MPDMFDNTPSADADVLERRRTERKSAPVEVPIRAEVVGTNESTDIYLCLLDVSDTGWRINSSEALPVGVPFNLRIHRRELGAEATGGEDDYLEASVTVPWQTELRGGAWVAGLHFTEPTRDTKEVLSSLVEDGASDATRRLRFRLRQAVRVEFRIADDEPWQHAVAIEISPDGIRMRSTTWPDDAGRCQVRIIPQGTLPQVIVNGRVVWCKTLGQSAHDVGLRFDDISPTDARIIQQHIYTVSSAMTTGTAKKPRAGG